MLFSIFLQARHDGQNYVFALLTGYRDPPAGVVVMFFFVLKYLLQHLFHAHHNLHYTLPLLKLLSLGDDCWHV